MRNFIISISQLLAVATFVIATNFLLNKILLGKTPFVGFTIIVIGFCLNFLILMFLQQKTSIFGELDLIKYLNIFFSSWIIYLLFFLKGLIFNPSANVNVILLRDHNINIIVSSVIVLMLQHLNRRNKNIYKCTNIYLFVASILILLSWRIIFIHL